MGIRVSSAGKLKIYSNNTNGIRQNSDLTVSSPFNSYQQNNGEIRFETENSVAEAACTVIEERNQSCISRFFDIITFKSSKKETDKPATIKAKQLLDAVEEKLKEQGIDLDKLNEEQQKQYLKNMLRHAYGLISNDEFLTQTTAFNKERLAHIVEENSKGLKKYFSFFRENFREAAEDSAKLNIAAVSTSSKHVPKEVANELLLLYSSTIPERRKEIITEALKHLPEGISKEKILELAMSSENMSVLEINFAKECIQNSDLPEEVKQEKLKMLEQYATQESLHNITQIIVQDICNYRNVAFKKTMYIVDNEDEKIDYIQQNKKELENKEDELLEEKAKKESQIYNQKIKLRKIKNKYNGKLATTTSSTNPFKKTLEREKNELHTMLKEFKDINSDISLNSGNIASQNMELNLHLNFKSNVIASSGLA